ncbi:hypothetical protein GCM10010340_10680 [Streptomyces griseoloalbus]|nr:hypothetical protein GCM10010340_10680 [Streptomyces albaduncus]
MGHDPVGGHMHVPEQHGAAGRAALPGAVPPMPESAADSRRTTTPRVRALTSAPPWERGK